MAGRNYSSHKFSQVLRKDGTLDVDKLARECSHDVFEDRRHRRVDDMKKKGRTTIMATEAAQEDWVKYVASLGADARLRAVAVRARGASAAAKRRAESSAEDLRVLSAPSGPRGLHGARVLIRRRRTVRP